MTKILKEISVSYFMPQRPGYWLKITRKDDFKDTSLHVA